MNLREALEVLQRARKQGLHRDLIEYLLEADLDYALLSFAEVDQLEAVGTYCWYVEADLDPSSSVPMYYYLIGGLK